MPLDRIMLCVVYHHNVRLGCVIANADVWHHPAFRCEPGYKVVVRAIRGFTRTAMNTLVREGRGTLKEKRVIRINLEGGIVQSVTGIPDDVVLKIYDYDVEEEGHPNVTKDEEGNLVFVNTWTSDDDATHALRGARR